MKAILVFVTILLSCSFTKAQYYLKIGGGYCNTVFKKDVLKNGSLERVERASFTKGVSLNVSVGRTLNQFFRAELEANVIGGIGTKCDVTDPFENAAGPQRLTKYYSTILANQYYLIPSLLFNAGDSAFKFYTRAGLMLCAGSNLIQKNNIEYVYGTNITNSHYTLVYSEKPSFGYIQSVGYILRLSKEFKFWFEVACRISTVKLNSPRLNSQTVAVDYSYVHLANPDKVHMNSLGVQAGLLFDIRSKKKSSH